MNSDQGRNEVPGARPDPTVVALDALVPDGAAGNGVHWALTDNLDLNVNLAHLDAGAEVAAHVNDAVDVVIVVLEGAGVARVDGREHPLSPHVLVVVPAGTERSLRASDAGLTYLTVHRRRGPLTIGRRAEPVDADAGGDPPCWAHDHEDY